MAKIIQVKAARKSTTCEKCSETIAVGDGYKHVTLKTGPRSSWQRKRCSKCPSWRPSELTTSKRGGVYAAQEAFEDEVAMMDCDTDPEELLHALQSCADSIREVAEEYRESASNIEDGFGHATFMSEELEGTADELESWADELETVDLSELEGCEAHDENEEDCEECQEVKSGWWDECVSVADDAVNNCPV